MLKKRSRQKAGANVVEGSAPLSHNSNGKAAVAISDVNDKQIIAQDRGERIKAAL